MSAVAEEETSTRPSEPSYHARFARQKIKVDGTVIDVLALGEGSELPIGADLSGDMDRVSAQLAYWGAVVGDARAELTKVDAHYRRFRAQFADQVLVREPKTSEWRVKNAIEASDGFVQFKNAIAGAEKNLAIAEGMVRAFDKKANLLQSKGARMRSEIQTQGLSTPAEPREPRGWNLSGQGSEADDAGYLASSERRPSTDEKIKRMEEINGARAHNGKKKKKRGK